NLYFCLLTDFTDAAEKVISSDDEALKTAINGIERLNTKYQRNTGNLFYLLHRPRKWNAHQKVWMGYERKRGKLADLNALLQGSGKKYFSVIIGDQNVFPQIKYVITLDEDTQLPLGS